MTTVERDVTARGRVDADPRQRRGVHRMRAGRVPVITFLIALVFFFGPPAAYLAGVQASQIDNRALTKLPSISQGWDALPQLGRWATDHLAGRKQAVDANGALSRGVYREDPKYGTDSGGSVVYPRVIEGKDGWLYFGGDVSNRCNPAAPVEQVIASMRQLAQAVTASGRRFILVVAPDKSTFYPEHLPAQFAGKRCLAPRNDAFWRQLRATPGIGSLDLRAALQRGADRNGELVYRPHDTHFSGYGASIYGQLLASALDPRLSTGTPVEPGPEVNSRGDLSLFLGHPVNDRLAGYPLHRTGVTLIPGSDPNLRYSVTRVRNTTSSAPLYGEPTMLLGDSFTQTSASHLVPYFADLRLLYSEIVKSSPQLVANALIDRGTVIYEIVERSASTGYAALLAPASIKVIRDALATHSYKR
ncbi:MAG: hypothetical protein ABJB98_06630 [Actinomycetota bacterium]